jgi:hypothetical protein
MLNWLSKDNFTFTHRIYTVNVLIIKKVSLENVIKKDSFMTEYIDVTNITLAP